MEKAERDVELPSGFTAQWNGHSIMISYQGKSVNREIGKEKVAVEVEGNKIRIIMGRNTKRENTVLNTLETHLHNMVKGLQKPFEYRLGVVFSHFPMTISVKGEWVEVNNFLGEKRPRKARILPDTKVEVKGKEVIVTSIHKEHAGQTAANLENITKVRGRDQRIYQDGIYITSASK